MGLYMSVSSVQDWMTCKRLYYYKRIKKYELIGYSLPFITGRIIHEGIAAVLAKKKNAIEIMTQVYKKERTNVVNQFVLSVEELEKLEMQEFITKGMLLAYQKKYSKMIADMSLMGSEVEGAIDLGNDVTFVLKLDNIVRIRKKKLLHEFKSTKTLTPDYVKRIQTNLQISVYYWFHNEIWPDEPIEEIMYDIVQKPSIRIKKKESKQQFLERLQEWYSAPGEGKAFHIERFKEPGIDRDSIINTVVKVSEEMLRTKEKDEYFQDYENCRSYYGDVCPYLRLCFEGGETKENMVLYQIKKSYHVNKDNEGVEK